MNSEKLYTISSHSHFSGHAEVEYSPKDLSDVISVRQCLTPLHQYIAVPTCRQKQRRLHGKAQQFLKRDADSRLRRSGTTPALLQDSMPQQEGSFEHILGYRMASAKTRRA